jgi:hypothetical protein
MFAAIKKKELAAELRPFHLFNYDYSRPSTLSGTPACRLYEKREKRKIRLDRRFSSTLAYTRQDRLNSIKNKNRKNAVVVVGKHHLAHATVWVLHSCPGSATEHIAVFFFSYCVEGAAPAASRLCIVSTACCFPRSMDATSSSMPAPDAADTAA